ncbi:MAG: hypothetical protein R2825_30145 [Saprospiraceae bacterium]
MTNANSYLLPFENLLDETIQQAWAVKDISGHLSALTVGAGELVEAAIKVGEDSFGQLAPKMGRTQAEEKLPNYIIDFIWADRVKSFFILWRDVLFQQQKAHILWLDHKITEAAVEDLQRQSKEVVEAAAAEIKNVVERETSILKKNKNSAKKNITKWEQQQNPWPIYKNQLEKLAEQCQHLDQQFEQIKTLSENFHFIKKTAEEEITWCKNEISEIKQTAQNTIAYIAENLESKLSRIPPYLQEAETKINVRNHLNDFTEIYEKELEALQGKTEVPVSIDGGILQYKEINIKRSARQWLESEILPLFYEIWELTDNVSYGMKMSLVNIRNRVILATNENKDGAKDAGSIADISQPLNTFLIKADGWGKNLQELERMIGERLSAQFKISNLYDLSGEFLPVSLEYTINRFGIDRNELIEKAREWLGRLTGRVAQIKTTVAQEEILSDSERVVRYVQSRKGDENNNQYASIFLTKGYLGESFWVGRANEIRHLENVIGQWRLGYRGAVVLSGIRFCGKSLFGEIIANRFFPEQTIRLSPNTTLKVQGRTLETGYDLGKALDFIRKHTLNERPLVWIDDLEIWSDEAFSLQTNVRHLKKHIDNYSDQLFYMVSMSNWVKSHLDRIFDISKIFQTEIRLDRMGQDEIRKAILIRHGATHKTLVDGKGEEINPKLFDKLISNIYRSVGGNIGDALNQWAFSTAKIDDERVFHQYSATQDFPDFLNPDRAVLLAAILMEKRTNEYRLRKMFGPSFQEKYGSILKRLLSVGLLSRQLDGWLELNEVAANEIARRLERKDYLKFN